MLKIIDHPQVMKSFPILFLNTEGIEGINEKIIMLLFVLLFVVSGCSPRITQGQKDRLNNLLKEWSVLDKITTQGLGYYAYQEQLLTAQGAFSHALENWPNDPLSDLALPFFRAFEGWTLTKTNDPEGKWTGYPIHSDNDIESVKLLVSENFNKLK